jgi:hypothetical protein
MRLGGDAKVVAGKEQMDAGGFGQMLLAKGIPSALTKQIKHLTLLFVACPPCLGDLWTASGPVARPDGPCALSIAASALASARASASSICSRIRRTSAAMAPSIG